MSRPLVVLVGDTHVGGYTALFPPQFQLTDGNTLLASPVQQTLYAWWIDFWRNVHVRRQGRKLIVVHMGDVVDGVVRRNVQSIGNIADQEHCAIELLTPVRKMADEWHQVAGTEAHVGEAWQCEKRIAAALSATTFGPELILDVNGVRFDLGHHGRVGSRPWSTSAVGVVAEVLHDCMLYKWDVPRFVVRGHTHRVDDSGEANPLCRAFITPAWQLRNAFSYRYNSFRRSDVGGVIVDGENVEFKRYYGSAGQRAVFQSKTETGGDAGNSVPAARDIPVHTARGFGD